MTTKEQIHKLIEDKQPISPGAILEYIDIGEQMLYRHLKKLLDEGIIEKIGSSPKVFYKTKLRDGNVISAVFKPDVTDLLNEEFYYIKPDGRELVGRDGFISWCLDRNFDLQKKSQEFFNIVKKYRKLKKDNVLDATAKLKSTFDAGADELYYYDFYAVEIFGKTKMGQKLLYAKQSENKNLMKEIIDEVRPVVMSLVKNKKIDAVSFVQPTVPRKHQFMKVLEKELNLPLPKIKVTKVVSGIRVPQKTLKKLSDRIENANETFVVEGSASFNRVLLIDDAVGSGASINQVAIKLKERGIAKTVIGFAITGSLNDFDVISEV